MTGSPTTSAPQSRDDAPPPGGRRFSWVSGTVAGIVLATFFSDFGHEVATACLPLYVARLGLGPASIGWIEGTADLLVCLSRFGGGVLGHRIERKKPWVAAGYLVTALGTSAMGLASSVRSLVILRTAAWIGRGFRGPLRDHWLADAVPRTHYARAYGLERAGDMLGAVAGPVAAALLLWLGADLRIVLLASALPGVLAAASIVFLAKERGAPPPAAAGANPKNRRAPIPRAFWLFLVGVVLFGLGDFSRTFLIWLSTRAIEPSAGASSVAVLSVPALLYGGHNLLSAGAAAVAGSMGDRMRKVRVLVFGYAIGVATHLVLALRGESLAWLVVAIAGSALYVAVEETLEKATAAELLPRELRSLGLGILAAANAVGDMVSSLYVGTLLEAGSPGIAFGIAAGCAFLGAAWLALVLGLRRAAAPRGD